MTFSGETPPPIPGYRLRSLGAMFSRQRTTPILTDAPQVYVKFWAPLALGMGPRQRWYGRFVLSVVTILSDPAVRVACVCTATSTGACAVSATHQLPRKHVATARVVHPRHRVAGRSERAGSQAIGSPAPVGAKSVVGCAKNPSTSARANGGSAPACTHQRPFLSQPSRYAGS